MIENRKIVLKSRPTGLPGKENFAVETESLGDPPAGMALIEVSRISIDAFIRTTLEDEAFHGSVPVGGTVVALGVGRVLASAAEGLTEGDWVTGPTMVQTHAMMPGAAFRKIDVSVAEPSDYLGLLGMTTGLTAYFGMLEVAGVNEGDTVVVSGAAGAVGSVACQLASIHGGRVIGIAGGPDKVRYLSETIGAAAGIDYKNDDVGARLSELAPEGINVFFDNVGGETLDLVLDRLASGARIAICGAISQYDHMHDVRGPSLYLRLAERNSCMCGFTVDRFQNRFEEASSQLRTWMQKGRLQLPEHVESGIEQFPAALARLFTGGHMGKLLLAP